MASSGKELKALRENKNLSLAQVAQDTRIAARHLLNLEEEQYQDLPGGMYNRAFLRTYCNYLDVDPKGFLEYYGRETGSVPDNPPKRLRPAPLPVSPSRSHPLAVWTVGLLLSVGGLYLGRSWISAVFAPYFSPPPPSAITSIILRSQPAVAETQSVSSSLAAASSTAVIPVPGSSETGVADAAPAEPEAVPGKFRLSVEVVEDCWVSLHSDGNRVLVRILKPGEDHTYGADEQFYLIVGNAGGVHLKINGMPLKPLGKAGSVVKLMITEQNLQELLEKSTS